MRKIAFLILLAITFPHINLAKSQISISKHKKRKQQRKELYQEIAQVRIDMRASKKEYKHAKKVRSDKEDLHELHTKKIEALMACTCKKSTPQTIEAAIQELERVEGVITNKKKSIQQFQHATRKKIAQLNEKRKNILREIREL